jgi:murein DD-endopeptidase MepM/ murein hydrolase activator NlpD
MRNKIYVSLSLGMTLMLASTISDAKTAHPSGKKQATTAPKHAKVSTREVASAKKSTSKPKLVTTAGRHSVATSKHHEHFLANSKNPAKHDKNLHEGKLAKRVKNMHEEKLAKHKSHKQNLREERLHALVYNRHHKQHSKKFHQVAVFHRSRRHGHRSEVIEQVAESDQQTEEAVESTETVAQTSDVAQTESSESTQTQTVPVVENTSQTESNWGKQLTDAIYSKSRFHSMIDGQIKRNVIGTTSGIEEAPAHVNRVHAVINTSLSDAATDAGLSDELVIQLTDIFRWDIDFANNLRPGDQFTLVFEDPSSGSGENAIIAAQFVNQGRTVTAIRYKDHEGMVNYYAPDGKSMRKTFLTVPVDYARISSHFSTHRRHPILNRIRAHKGVDYAARTGTPVKAAGNGTVSFLGRKGAYGQMLIIDHGGHNETVYAHLSNFKTGLGMGDTVKQGDIVAFVGQTGLATGPHLHYEFRINGVHQNPENLNAQNSIALDNDLWNDFHAKALPLLVQINRTKSDSMFAKNRYINSLTD